MGSEWGRVHYQVHQPNRGNRFLDDKIAVLEHLMKTDGHTHLVLAGDPEITRQLRHALPAHLTDKLVDIIPTTETDQPADIVLATLSSFIKYEEQESHTAVEELILGLRGQNLAVAGSTAVLNALRWKNVDTLIMASTYQPDPGWTCKSCKAISTGSPDTFKCPRCHRSSVQSIDIRETLLRLAEQLECTIEVVAHSDALMSLGGVGCLLQSQPELKLKTMKAESADLVASR